MFQSFFDLIQQLEHHQCLELNQITKFQEILEHENDWRNRLRLELGSIPGDTDTRSFVQTPAN